MSRVEAEEKAEKELGAAYLPTKRLEGPLKDLRIFVEAFRKDRYFRSAFLNELKKHLNIAKEDLICGLVKAFQRVVVVRRGRLFWFPFLRSAYFRATYDPSGPSNYSFIKGTLYKATYYPGSRDITVENGTEQWWKEQLFNV